MCESAWSTAEDLHGVPVEVTGFFVGGGCKMCVTFIKPLSNCNHLVAGLPPRRPRRAARRSYGVNRRFFCGVRVNIIYVNLLL